MRSTSAVVYIEFIVRVLSIAAILMAVFEFRRRKRSEGPHWWLYAIIAVLLLLIRIQLPREAADPNAPSIERCRQAVMASLGRSRIGQASRSFVYWVGDDRHITIHFADVGDDGASVPRRATCYWEQGGLRTRIAEPGDVEDPEDVRPVR